MQMTRTPGETVIFSRVKTPEGNYEVLSAQAETITLDAGTLSARILLKICHTSPASLSELGLGSEPGDPKSLKVDSDSSQQFMRQLSQTVGTNILTTPNNIARPHQTATMEIRTLLSRSHSRLYQLGRHHLHP